MGTEITDFLEILSDKEYYSGDFENKFETSIITLYSGMKFQSWIELENYLYQYALQEGFSYKRTRVDYHLNHNEMLNLTTEEKQLYIKRRTYECTHSRHHTTKKIVALETQRNRDSHQIDCPWQLNVTKPKKDNLIGVTSVHLEYNYDMNPLAREMFPKFRKFTQPILDDIEFYVKHGTTSARAILPLLHAKFPEQPICKKDLYNAIQKFKVGQKNASENDASNLL